MSVKRVDVRGAPDRHEPITVITVTRKRNQALARAMASVRTQDYPGPIEHLILVDDDSDTIETIKRSPSDDQRRVRWRFEPRPASERGPAADARNSIYPRLARLLNIGIQTANSPWLAFLDDDNTFEPEHLSSLMACLRAEGARAAHSARAIYWANGLPYLEPSFPGASSPEEGTRIYQLMCERGVWIRGTNVLMDRVDPVQSTFRNSTVMGADDPIFLVDQNLWLIDRNILLKHPISESFTEKEIAANTCPDDKMLEGLVRNGVRIVASRRATVRYYLGGISNHMSNDLLTVSSLSDRSDTATR